METSLMPREQTPIAYGPRIYMALRDLTKRLGVEFTDGFTALDGTIVFTVAEPHHVTLLAMDAGVPAFELDGRRTCKRGITGVLCKIQSPKPAETSDDGGAA